MLTLPLIRVCIIFYGLTFQSICGGFVVLVVGLTTLLQATVFGNLDSSLVGLALSYVLMV